MKYKIQYQRQELHQAHRVYFVQQSNGLCDLLLIESQSDWQLNSSQYVVQRAVLSIDGRHQFGSELEEIRTPIFVPLMPARRTQGWVSKIDTTQLVKRCASGMSNNLEFRVYIGHCIQIPRIRQLRTNG
jgi:hypothetical protein